MLLHGNTIKAVRTVAIIMASSPCNSYPNLDKKHGGPVWTNAADIMDHEQQAIDGRTDGRTDGCNDVQRSDGDDYGGDAVSATGCTL